VQDDDAAGDEITAYAEGGVEDGRSPLETMRISRARNGLSEVVNTPVAEQASLDVQPLADLGAQHPRLPVQLLGGVWR